MDDNIDVNSKGEGLASHTARHKCGVRSQAVSIEVLAHYTLRPLSKWLNLPALVSLSVKMGQLEHQLHRAVASTY